MPSFPGTSGDRGSGKRDSLARGPGCGIGQSPTLLVDSLLEDVEVGERALLMIYRKPWLDRESVRKATSEYIEVFYNRIRRHSTIGNISPAKFEEMNQAEAA